MLRVGDLILIGLILIIMVDVMKKFDSSERFKEWFDERFKQYLKELELEQKEQIKKYKNKNH